MNFRFALLTIVGAGLAACAAESALDTTNSGLSLCVDSECAQGEACTFDFATGDNVCTPLPEYCGIAYPCTVPSTNVRTLCPEGEDGECFVCGDGYCDMDENEPDYCPRDCGRRLCNEESGFGECSVRTVTCASDEDCPVGFCESGACIMRACDEDCGSPELRCRDNLCESGSLVINEVDYDQESLDRADYVELYNAGRNPIDLTRIELVFVNGALGPNNPRVVYERVALGGVVEGDMLAPGTYLVVGASPVGSELPEGSAFVDAGADFNIQNANDTAPDGIALIDTTSGLLLDALSYGGNEIDLNDRGVRDVNIDGQNYSLVEGTPTEAEDVGSDGVTLIRFPNGSDRHDARVDWMTTASPTPGAPNVADFQGLLINEIDYDQPGADGAEFIEIYNPTDRVIDLRAVQLLLLNGNEATEPVAYYDRTLTRTIAPGEFIVIGDPGLNVPNEVRYFPIAGFNIQNGSPDGVVLLDLINGTLIDGLSYEGTIDDGELFRLTGTRSTSLADGNDTGSLSRASEIWRLSPTPTPGMANEFPNAELPEPIED